MSNFTRANREFESIAEFELILLKEEYFLLRNLGPKPRPFRTAFLVYGVVQ